MARSIHPDIYAALLEGRLVARDFVWIVGRTRDAEPTPVSQGFWSDVMNVVASVREPINLSVVNRTFVGSGTLIQISAIPAVSNLTTQTVTVKMSQLNETVAEMIRVYDVRQAQIEIYRGIFDPASRELLDAAVCRFFGRIDQVEITTPAENEEGGIELTCTSHTAELNRSNPETRSDESQRKRNPTDNFFQDTASVGERRLFWGKIKGTVTTKKTGKGDRSTPFLGTGILR